MTRDRKEYFLKYNKQYYLENRDRELQRMKVYDAKNRHKPSLRFSKARSQAKKRNIEFTLTLDEFIKISGENCYYCDEKMIDRTNKGGSHLDRIDNNKGYHKDNVVSCCEVCNTMRNKFLTPEETKVAVLAILHFRSGNKVALKSEDCSL